MPAHQHYKGHYQYVNKVNWQQVLPLQGKQLVNSQSWKCPFEPHHQEDYKKCLAYIPYKRRNKIHYMVKPFPATNMKWHPAPEKDSCSN